MKRAVDLDTLRVGDRICFLDVDELDAGTFTRIEYDRYGYRYYFKWEDGTEWYLTPSTLRDIDRCWMYEGDCEDVKAVSHKTITRKDIATVLDLYHVDKCPRYCRGGNVGINATVEYILAALKQQEDSEYQEYLRMKAKFEK